MGLHAGETVGHVEIAAGIEPGFSASRIDGPVALRAGALENRVRSDEGREDILAAVFKDRQFVIARRVELETILGHPAIAAVADFRLDDIAKEIQILVIDHDRVAGQHEIAINVAFGIGRRSGQRGIGERQKLLQHLAGFVVEAIDRVKRRPEDVAIRIESETAVAVPQGVQFAVGQFDDIGFVPGCRGTVGIPAIDQTGVSRGAIRFDDGAIIAVGLEPDFAFRIADDAVAAGVDQQVIVGKVLHELPFGEALNAEKNEKGQYYCCNSSHDFLLLRVRSGVNWK